MPHTPVLAAEVIETLAPRPGGCVLDGTVGSGGHAELILDSLGPDGCLVGLDRDRAALDLARERLARFGDRVRLVHADFAELARVLDEADIETVGGVLLDLGLSSMQLGDPERGFSLKREGPLDMRMDRGSGRPASELVNGLAEAELADLLWKYGDERRSRGIARAIVRARPLKTTREFAEVVARAAHVKGRWRIHPATRTFQALRIAVNGELESLEAALPAAEARLAVGARLVVVSFHSLEDRIVKRFLRERSRAGAWTVLTRKPVRPSADEVRANRRARSARLRAAERAERKE